MRKAVSRSSAWRGGMPRSASALRRRTASAWRVALAEQFGLEQIEIAQLLVRRERRMIGDVVGGADEIVEGKDQRPVPRMDDPRGDRKILVAVRLAGPQVAGAAHREWRHRHWWFARKQRGRDAPHIGEYAGKTNAFAGRCAVQPRACHKAVGEVAAGGFGAKRRLLAVVLQHLIAGRRNLRAVLLQAGENHEVALVDDAAAVALNVAVAGGLLFRRAAARGLRRLLGEGRGCGGDESEGQDRARTNLRM